MLGTLALVFMLVPVLVGTITYQTMKKTWQVPAHLNIPGVFAVSLAVFLFTGWISSASGLFNRYAFSPSTMPDVPWYQPIVFLAFSIIWYGVVVRLLLRLRAKHSLEANIHYTP